MKKQKTTNALYEIMIDGVIAIATMGAVDAVSDSTVRGINGMINAAHEPEIRKGLFGRTILVDPSTGRKLKHYVPKSIINPKNEAIYMIGKRGVGAGASAVLIKERRDIKKAQKKIIGEINGYKYTGTDISPNEVLK